MKTILLVAMTLICVLQLTLAEEEGEKPECFDKEKMKGKRGKMKEFMQKIKEDCKEANPDDKKAMKDCWKTQMKEKFKSFKEKNLDDIKAKIMEAVLPEKQSELEGVFDECKKDAGEEVKAVMKCWHQEVRKRCKGPGRHGKGHKKGGSGEDGSGEKSKSGEEPPPPEAFED